MKPFERNKIIKTMEDVNRLGGWQWFRLRFELDFARGARCSSRTGERRILELVFSFL